MIDELIQEMTMTCQVCGGSGIKSRYDEDDDAKCTDCNGTGVIISPDGEKLRQIILKGEIL